jgi:hypothetical protein
MKTSELRIGNLVKCKKSNDHGIYQVMALDGFNLKIMLGGVRMDEWNDEHQIKPIPLTTDWIKKFGFWEEYSSGHETGYFSKKFVNITIAENGFYCYCGDCRRHISLTLYYVHQLQNLFFSLTGEELTYKI